MPLHLDKRPADLASFMGNDGIKESIRTVFAREDRPHAVMLVGPSGCGKTTLGRIIATLVGCTKESIREYNSANTRGVDTIREIAENAQYAPTTGKVKVYILDECHKLTNDAQNALLKTLEDTPKHVYFILCTTDPDKMIKAVKTRCMNFEVKSLPNPVLTKLVKDTLASEGIDDFPVKVINEIVKAAAGCPRQALILLDSVIDILDEDAALQAISEATATETASIEVCRLLLETRSGKWPAMKELLKGLPDDAENLRYSILGYMANVMIGDKTNEATTKQAAMVIDCFTESFMYTKKAGLVNACYNACLL